MFYGEAENNIILSVERALRGLSAELNIPPQNLSTEQLKVELDIPKERAHGDLSSNIAMRLAKAFGREPLALAGLISGKLSQQPGGAGLGDFVERVEAKSPGFINFFLSKKYLCGILLEIKRKQRSFGRCGIGRGVKLQVEFVSANPTGPLTIAHGRQAAIGDSLARIFSFFGYDVTREYYINDEGTQMDILGNSIRARYRELLGIKEDFPQDGYKGRYISDIARDFRKRCGRKYADSKDIAPFREFGLKWIMADIRKDLKDFGVKFDVWYSQKALRRSGKVEKALGILKKRGYIYEKEGASWFRSQAFGDDKDRVVVKSDGNMTYLAPDIAYHLDKFRRGFRKVIDIWGPDHHGYINRLKASVQALGYKADAVDVLIVQLATLYRGGQAVTMSTRAGEFVTLREVMDEVGKDVARFCFTMRRTASHLDFDLDILKKESMENPVYYIQYAHARVWSILQFSRDSRRRRAAKFESALLKEEEELLILRILKQFPTVVVLSARSLEPYTILQYLHDLAGAFHSFYNRHRVVSDDPNLMQARLVLVDCVRIVLANGLRLLGVSLPKKM
jgi:arginyl-tRNA synthetase